MDCGSPAPAPAASSVSWSAWGSGRTIWILRLIVSRSWVRLGLLDGVGRGRARGFGLWRLCASVGR